MLMMLRLLRLALSSLCCLIIVYAPAFSKQKTFSKPETDALIYSDYQRYKLSQKNDYSSIIDKQYAIALIRPIMRNPLMWSSGSHRGYPPRPE